MFMGMAVYFLRYHCLFNSVEKKKKKRKKRVISNYELAVGTV